MSIRDVLAAVVTTRAPPGAQFSTFPIWSAKKNKMLPDTPARTRFAPSPTGYLHLGSLRTALFNYLLARRTKGQFILRVEDTDQSERTHLYKTEAEKLVACGAAYRCFCTPQRLDELARHHNDLGLPPIYDGACRSISAEESEERVHRNEPHVIRLKVTKPYPMFEDIVFGKTGYNRSGKKDSGLLASQIGDPILIKSDGHPTYHLANVVDDHYMKVTHVIRGSEWMSSTPMHMALYEAFGWKAPEFAHVPLLCDTTGAKLSKRNNDIGISSFREQGLLPETLANFTVLLGWSHSGRSDVLSLEQLRSTFDLKLTKGNAIVNFDKMWFLQKAHSLRYAKEGGRGLEAMVEKVVQATQARFTPEQLAKVLRERPLYEYVRTLFEEGARNYTTAEAFLDANLSFFTHVLQRPQFTHPPSKPSVDGTTSPTIPLSKLYTAAAALTLVPSSHWTAKTHKSNIEAYMVDPTSGIDQKLFKKELYHYLRWALSGGTPGIGIPSTMAILGREESIRRLDEAKNLTMEMAKAEGFGARRRVPMGVGSSCFGGCGCGSGNKGPQ
ncbi:Glutamate--tRNA ligase mitochondrial [Ascosphaera aggregata]|nr:Glutamate--tRNA ligase mitochondrial [Ascosphaera aggregata]